MSDIFREIEQEARRDQALNLWRKAQIPVYVLAVLIVIATGVWRYWQTQRQQAAEAAGARYEAALALASSGKPEDAQKALQEIAKGTDGYALLARFRSASAQAAKDPAGAAKAYDAIAADPSAPSIMQNLARLRSALLHMNDADSKDVVARLNTLAAPTGPFHASARELLALIALKDKKYDEAGRWLDTIVSDPSAPTGVRGRAQSLAGLVASSGPPPKPTAPAASSAAPAAAAAPSSPAPAANSVSPSPAAPSPNASPAAPGASPSVAAPSFVGAPPPMSVSPSVSPSVAPSASPPAPPASSSAPAPSSPPASPAPASH